VIDLGRACNRHRDALLEFFDSGRIESGTGLALAHLDRCRRCTAELETTVLAITALRRWSDEIALAEPRADAWPRLRARIDRWRPIRSVLMSPLSGMAMSLAIVVGLVVPLSVRPDENPAATPSVIRPVDAGALELSVDRSRPITRSSNSTLVIIPIDPTGWAGPDGLGVQDSTSSRPVPRRSGSGGPL
jgi:hypothetical protein